MTVDYLDPALPVDIDMRLPLFENLVKHWGDKDGDPETAIELLQRDANERIRAASRHSDMKVEVQPAQATFTPTVAMQNTAPIPIVVENSFDIMPPENINQLPRRRPRYVVQPPKAAGSVQGEMDPKPLAALHRALLAWGEEEVREASRTTESLLHRAARWWHRVKAECKYIYEEMKSERIWDR